LGRRGLRRRILGGRFAASDEQESNEADDLWGPQVLLLPGHTFRARRRPEPRPKTGSQGYCGDGAEGSPFADRFAFRDGELRVVGRTTFRSLFLRMLLSPLAPWKPLNSPRPACPYNTKHTQTCPHCAVHHVGQQLGAYCHGAGTRGEPGNVGGDYIAHRLPGGEKQGPAGNPGGPLVPPRGTRKRAATVGRGRLPRVTPAAAIPC